MADHFTKQSALHCRAGEVLRGTPEFRFVGSERVFLLVSIASLLAGIVMYLGFRTDSLLVFKWLSYVELSGSIEVMRTYTLPYSVRLPKWLIFSAPNGLWILSFSALMLTIWGRENLLAAVYWTATLWIVGITSEFLQAMDLLSGVFDIGDLISYTIGCFGIFLFVTRSGERSGP